MRCRLISRTEYPSVPRAEACRTSTERTIHPEDIHPKDSIGGGGSTARRARSQTARSKSTAWGRDERHYSLGWGQSSRICMEVASTTTLLSPGERVRRGTSLRWRLMSRTELEKRVVARPRQSAGKNGETAQSQRGIASHVCYSTSSWCDSDGIPTERLEPTKDSRSNVFSTSSFSPHNGF